MVCYENHNLKVNHVIRTVLFYQDIDCIHLNQMYIWLMYSSLIQQFGW